MVNENYAGRMTVPGKRPQVAIKTVLYTALLLCICGTVSFAVPSLQMVFSFVALLVLAVSFYNGSFEYMLLPLLMFYECLVIPGISVYRIYTLLFLIQLLFSGAVRLSKGKRRYTYVLVSILYIIVAMGGYGLTIRRLLFLIVDLVFMLVYSEKLMHKALDFTRFSYVFVLSVICSAIAGLLDNAAFKTASVVNGEYVELSRFIGTFADPNYYGFFLNTAIFFLIIDTKIGKVPKVLGLAFLYFSMLASGSFTAILLNIMLVLLLLVISKKITFKTLFAVLVAIAAIYALCVYASTHEVAFISDFILRSQNKLEVSSDLNKLTSNRTGIWQRNFQFFDGQSALKILFGGNVINASALDGNLFGNVSHQEYIDILLCVGVLGFALIMVPQIISFVKKCIVARKTQDSFDLSVAMMKAVYLSYGVALTMYLDPRFMLHILA